MLRNRLLAAGLVMALLLVACGGGAPPPDVQPAVPGQGQEQGAAPAGDAGDADVGDVGDTGDTGFAEPGEAVAEATPAATSTPRPTSAAIIAAFPTIPPAGGGDDEEAPEGDVTEEGTGEGIAVEMTSGDEIRTGWMEIFMATPGTPFAVTMTDAALEGYLTDQIAEGEAADSISDIGVSLGEFVTVAFSLTVPGTDVAVDASVDFDVYATEGGALAVDVVSAQAGEQEVPEEFATLLTGAVAEVVSGESVDPAAGDVVSFTEVNIAEGRMTISGVVEQSS